MDYKLSNCIAKKKNKNMSEESPIYLSVDTNYDQNKLRAKGEKSINPAFNTGTVGTIILATHSRIIVRLKTRLRHLTDLFSIIRKKRLVSVTQARQPLQTSPHQSHALNKQPKGEPRARVEFLNSTINSVSHEWRYKTTTMFSLLFFLASPFSSEWR